jgi:hypothetical protein
MSEPKCIEVTASTSTGGRVQLVKFELSSDYHFSMTRRYSIPDDWTEDQVKEFNYEKTLELREQLEPIAQQEFDDLINQKKELNGS